MESITTSTASSASFLAILLRPERSSRAVREVDGSSWRLASTAWWRRVIESVMGPGEYPDLVAIVLIPAPGAARSLILCQKTRIAACGGSVDGHHLLGGEAAEVVGPTGFGTSAREPRAAERLRADDRTDYVPINVNVPVGQTRNDTIDREIDARVNAERERGAVRRYAIEQSIQCVGAPANDVQHRTKHFFHQIVGPIEFDDRRRHISAAVRQRPVAIPAETHAARPLLGGDPIVQLGLGVGIDHRANVGRGLTRIAEFQLARRADEHV